MIAQVECEVRAYSPYDAIDRKYHETHTNALTSRGRDSSLAGIASPFARGVRAIVPGYNGDQPTICDDTGAILRHSRTLIIEVRFQSEADARRWGVKHLTITVIYPDTDAR